MNAVERILAHEDGHINQHRDDTWQQRRDNAFRGKIPPDNQLPEGTFKQSTPGGIANTLKMKSEDLDQAMRRLNNYSNSQGRNIRGEERRKIDDTKEALRQAYGEPDKKEQKDADPNSRVAGGLQWDGNATVGFGDGDEELWGKEAGPNPLTAFQTSINTMPPVHNLDDTGLKTGLDEKSEQKPIHHIENNQDLLASAVSRLLSED